MMNGRVVEPPQIGALISILSTSGFTVVGPTISEGTIVLGRLGSASDLPIGWTEEQEKSTYRLTRRADDAYFGYTVGPASAKKWLFPPHQTVLTIEHVETGLRFRPEPVESERLAFLGLRACDLAAIAIQDRVFLGDRFTEPNYAARRRHSFTVGVNCSVAAPTCFCASMGTGPQCGSGYDLVITEVVSEDLHEFVVEPGTPEGEEILAQLVGRDMTEADEVRRDAIVADTTAHMGRSMDYAATHDLLVENPDLEVWDQIADRCLSCTNCTLVCPTCFCSTMEDVTDLDGTATRRRRWDSCFNVDFTTLHGHAVRSSTRSRYRQWMTHKLGYWFDQFGTSGCVGCGRCITWCPAQIDITEEVQRMQERIEVSP